MITLSRIYEAVGTIEDGSTIVLETPLPVRGRVKVQIHAETAEPDVALTDREAVLQAIHQRQRARGHKPMSPEEVEAYIRQTRSEDVDATGLSG